MQERLSEISRELEELTEKQDKLKAQMAEAKGGDNYAIVQALSAESEAATAKQLQLLTEQSDLMRRQRKSHKYVIDYSPPLDLYSHNTCFRPWECQVFQLERDFSCTFPLFIFARRSTPDNSSKIGVLQKEHEEFFILLQTFSF